MPTATIAFEDDSELPFGATVVFSVNTNMTDQDWRDIGELVAANPPGEMAEQTGWHVTRIVESDIVREVSIE
jgi:hypothetical protein